MSKQTLEKKIDDFVYDMVSDLESYDRNELDFAIRDKVVSVEAIAIAFVQEARKRLHATKY